MKYEELSLKNHDTWCSWWSYREEDGSLLLVDKKENKVIGKIVYIGSLNDAIIDLRDDVPKKDFFAAQKATKEKKGSEFWRVSSKTLQMLAINEKGELKSFRNITIIDQDDNLIILPGLYSYYDGECIREEIITSKKRLIKYIEEYNEIVVGI